jgi:hypothetical protein
MCRAVMERALRALRARSASISSTWSLWVVTTWALDEGVEAVRQVLDHRVEQEAEPPRVRGQVDPAVEPLAEVGDLGLVSQRDE